MLSGLFAYGAEILSNCYRVHYVLGEPLKTLWIVRQCWVLRNSATRTVWFLHDYMADRLDCYLGELEMGEIIGDV